MSMEKCAELWESLIYEAIKKGTKYPLSKDAAHGISIALRKEIVAQIMKTGVLLVPYFGKFEVRRHKGGMRVLPPIAGSKDRFIPPYFRLHFKANKAVRKELKKYES